MDKRFPVEPFEYGTEGEGDYEGDYEGQGDYESDGEDEVIVRDHRDPRRRGWQPPPPRANSLTPRWQNARWPNARWQNARWPNARWQNAWGQDPRWRNARWQDPRRQNAQWQNAQWQDPRWSRRNRPYRFPYLPFPPVAGCSCDAPATDEPQPPAPMDGDGAPPAPAAPAAPTGSPGPADQELGAWGSPWDMPATGMRGRKHRRAAAARAYPVSSLQRAFDEPPRPLHLDADEEDQTGGGAAPQLGTLAIAAAGRHQFSYTFTADDLLWTARFLTGEAGGADNLDNAAVIWTMFNRFGLFTHSRYSTFHRFLRAYSTPLQRVLHSSGAARRHVHDPSFVTTGERYPGTDIPKGQLRRFLQLQERPWDKLPRGARSLALRALQGGVPNPIGNATEFASTAVYFRDRHGKSARLDEATWRQFTERYAASKRWTWIGDVAGLNQRNNAFFVDQRVAALPAGAVRVSP